MKEGKKRGKEKRREGRWKGGGKEERKREFGVSSVRKKIGPFVRIP